MGERHVRSSLPSVAGIGDRALAQPLVCLPRPGRTTAGDLSSSDPGRGRGAGPDHRQSWLPGRHADRRPCLAASPGQPLPTAAALGGVGPRHRGRQDPPGSRSDPRVDGAPSRDPTAATLPLPCGPAEVVEGARSQRAAPATSGKTPRRSLSVPAISRPPWAGTKRRSSGRCTTCRSFRTSNRRWSWATRCLPRRPTPGP